MNQGHIKLDQLEVLVLDEADRMLDMGFLPDLQRIISELPSKRQSLFFSATFPPKIRALSRELLINPVSVNVTPKSTSLETIEQQVLFVERSGKQSLLRTILRSANVDRALVFTRTKRGANVLAQNLMSSGINATAIHGNKSQNARQQALEAFRRNKVQVLVATDVAARGIDIDGITHVINFELPVEPESYVHRIGRTGRAGADGIAMSFCSASERGELLAIEKLIGNKVPIAAGHLEPERAQPEPRRKRPARQSPGVRSAVGWRPAPRPRWRCAPPLLDQPTLPATWNVRSVDGAHGVEREIQSEARAGTVHGRRPTARPLNKPEKTRSHSIAKNQNTFAKRQREMNKKAKAEAKRNRRHQRKQGDDVSHSIASQDVEDDMEDAETDAAANTDDPPI